MGWQVIFGYLAGALITGAFIPQVWRLFKTRRAHDISLPFTLILTCGGFLWLTYGIVFNQMPIIITNVFTTLLNVLMIVAKLKYGRTPIDEQRP